MRKLPVLLACVTVVAVVFLALQGLPVKADSGSVVLLPHDDEKASIGNLEIGDTVEFDWSGVSSIYTPTCYFCIKNDEGTIVQSSEFHNINFASGSVVIIEDGHYYFYWESNSDYSMEIEYSFSITENPCCCLGCCSYCMFIPVGATLLAGAALIIRFRH